MNFYNMPQLGKQDKYKHKTIKIKEIKALSEDRKRIPDPPTADRFVKILEMGFWA